MVGCQPGETELNTLIVDSSIPKVSDNRPFMHDLVLLSGPNDVLVPCQGARLMLMEHGDVVTGCRFTKAMNSGQVELTIFEAPSWSRNEGLWHNAFVFPTNSGDLVLLHMCKVFQDGEMRTEIDTIF